MIGREIRWISLQDGRHGGVSFEGPVQKLPDDRPAPPGGMDKIPTSIFYKNFHSSIIRIQPKVSHSSTAAILIGNVKEL
jgi:hypothetical protein